MLIINVLISIQQYLLSNPNAINAVLVQFHYELWVCKDLPRNFVSNKSRTAVCLQ